MKKKINVAVELEQNPRKSGEFDPTKEWTDGHKFFNAAESKAYVELLNREAHTRTKFQSHKNVISRPRNPLNGDHTPRDAAGTVVLNPNAYGKAVGGSKLFSEGETYPDINETAVFKRRKQPIGKIGVPDARHQLLGNADVKLAPAQAEDPAYLAKQYHADKTRQKEEQMAVAEHINREKAKRHQRELARHLSLLRQEAEAKERELNFVQSTYGSVN